MKKTIEDHWSYIEALTRNTLPVEGNAAVYLTADKLVALIGFHYKSAFAHGWKHALEAQKSCCPEAASCARDLRSAVSVVSGAARRVLDAGDFGVKIFKNDAEGKSPTEEEIAHVLALLKEDR